MVVHFFIFTITISKRKGSGSDIERAYRKQCTEQIIEKNKLRCIHVQRMI